MARGRGFAPARKKYNPEVEGYGSPDEWASAFNQTMGFEQAQEVLRGDAQSPRQILGVGLGATWSEVRKAYRVAVVGCHPDRMKETGMTQAQAHEALKRVNAAFAVLKREMGQD
jgi:DnaJ-class molecular chaperone